MGNSDGNGNGWSSTGLLDTAGDPIFLSPDGSLWSVSRSVGSLASVLQRLNEGPSVPWSQMERLGHQSDWVVTVRSDSGEGDEWEQALRWVGERLKPLGEDIWYHHWERGPDFLLRWRLDEAAARRIMERLEGGQGFTVAGKPVLAHLAA